MIEIKNGSIATDNDWTIERLSFVVPDGHIVAVKAMSDDAATTLIDCFLGLKGLAEGFISIDGEPLLPTTKRLFCADMAFLPRRVRMPQKTVSELFDYVIELDVNGDLDHVKKKLLVEWRTMGLPASLYDADIESMDDGLLRLIMLTMIEQMRRKIVLLDNPTLAMDDQQAAKSIEIIKGMAQNNAAVLVATHDERLLAVCQSIVNIG